MLNITHSGDDDKPVTEPVTNHVNGDAESPNLKENLSDANEVNCEYELVVVDRFGP